MVLIARAAKTTRSTTGRIISTHADDRRGVGRPRSQHAQAAILDATTSLLGEVGYARLTVEGIAARAGVGKTTIYRRWTTKSAIVVEAIGSASPPAPAPTGDVRTDIRVLAERAVENLTSSPMGAALPALAVDVMSAPDGADTLEALLQPHRAAFLALFTDAVQQEILPADTDLGFVIDILASGLLHLAFIRPRARPQAISSLVALVLDGEVPRLRSDDTHVESTPDL